MPLGTQQNNNFLHLTMDVWQDQIFFHETVYPAGHFAAELLNVPEKTIRELVTHGGTISHQVEALALAGRGEFIKLLDGTRASLEKLLDALWHCPPYSLMDKGQEQHTLEVMFSPASHNDLLTSFACPGIFRPLSGRRLQHPPGHPALRRGGTIF